MSDDITNLREDLRKKWTHFKILIEKPQLHIVDYFDSIRSEIDYEIEKSLQESSTTFHGFHFNLTRTKLLEELSKQEKLLLNKVTVSGYSDKVDLQLRCASISKQIDEIFAPQNAKYLSLGDYEDHYAELVLQMLDETRKLERMVMSDQTFIYAASEEYKDGGCLLHLADHFFDSLEIECFKKFSKENAFPNGDLLFKYNQFLEGKRNELLCFGVRKPYIISKNMFTMSFLARLLKQRKPAQDQILHVDKNAPRIHFSGSQFRNNQSETEMILDCQSFEAFEDSSSLEYFSPSLVKLHLHRNKLKEVNISSDVASRLVSLNLSENRVDSLNKNFFASLKKVENLKLENTFIPGFNFDGGFLSSLLTLRELHLTVLTSFDFKCLKSLKGISELRLSTTSSTSKHVQPIKPALGLEAFEVLSSKKNLKILDLSGFDVGDSDSFKLLKMSGLVELILTNDEISKVEASTFISFAKTNRLDRLDLSGNNITSLPKGAFDSLSGLQYLNLSNNKLTSIQAGIFTKMPSLVFLILANNPISSIEANSFSGEATLYELDLSGCKLQCIDNLMFSGTRIRHKLSLSRNQIELIGLQVGTNTLSLNKPFYTSQEIQLIRENMFASLGQLEQLDLGGNQLQDLNLICFCNLKNLREFDLSYNKLRSLTNRYPDVSFANMNVLNLADNQLESLSYDFFSSFTKLQYLYLQNNPLTFTIKRDTFSSETSLNVLNLQNTKFIDFQDWIQLNNSFRLHLETSNPHLSWIVHGMKKLEYLGLSKSNQASIESLVKSQVVCLQKLVYFDLSNNSMTTLDGISLGKSCPQVTQIILANNLLRDLKPSWFEGLIRLETLDISHNLVQTIYDPSTFSGIKQTLKRLSIRDNRLSHIHRRLFRGMASLEVLDLANNQLQALDDGLFRDLFRLERISLSGNNIALLNMSRLFGKNHKVKLIDLSNNQLDDQSINESTFQDLGFRLELAELNLANNKLTNPYFICNLPYLRALNLRGNMIFSAYDELLSLFNLNVQTRALVSSQDLSNRKSYHLYTGPLWSHDHATKLCPDIAFRANKVWSGHWNTIVPGSASVCFCSDE